MSAFGQVSADEALWLAEEAGLIAKRPLRERWPRLFLPGKGLVGLTDAPCLPWPLGSPAESSAGCRLTEIQERCEILPGADDPLIPIPARWSRGMPLPATYEPEEIPGHPDYGLADGEPAPSAAPVDWLAERREKAAVSPGRHPITIEPGSIDLFATRIKASGVAFAVTVTEGEWQGGCFPCALS